MPVKKVTKKIEKKVEKKAEPKKETVKEVKDTKKVEPKKVADKKEVKETKVAKKVDTKEVKKAEVKKEEPKKAADKKEVKAETKEVKKAEPKKTAAKKEVKEETKKTEAKPAAKKETKKTAEKKVEKDVTKETKTTKPKKTEKATKTTTKDTKEVKKATKKTTTKKTDKVVDKVEKKETVKKATKAVRVAQYNSLSLDTCIEMARAMGVDLSYDGYADLLFDNTNLKTIATDLIKQYDLKTKGFTFEKDGYDTDLIQVLLEKVSNTVDVKASDFNDMASVAKECIAYTLSEDTKANNAEYHKEFALVKQFLMLAQRKDVHTTADLEKLVKYDMTDVVSHFMDVTYHVMKNWQYDDVRFYENFIYAVLSQFYDLHEQLSNRAMMDVADLYILHGDYGLGDANYGYIIRENDIKDYIYYRFASIYLDIDREKARSIAQSSLEYVDGRYTYYPNIIEILEG